MKTQLLMLALLSALCAGSANAQTQLWGTANGGGSNGQGTIFYTDGSGSNFHVAYNFVNATGAMPVGNMTLADNGMLYGETYLGGFGDSCVIFKFNPMTGEYTNIYDLYQHIQFGWGAWGGMTKASNGMLYGLCGIGGANYDGVIFRIDPATDTYTDIHDMVQIQGSTPLGGLVQCTDGKLYGMTQGGGSNSSGVIFSFDLATNTYDDLYSFVSSTGENPQYGKLMQATNGKLYGLTSQGGTSSRGVIFSFDPVTGDYADLHDFGGVDGGSPEGSLVQAENGMLYGMTYAGGANNTGVLFSYDINLNSYTNLVDFIGTNGSSPRRGLTVGSDGMLYGTTSAGGTSDNGVAFSYNTVTNTYAKLFDFNGNITGSGPDCDIIVTPLLTPTGLTNLSIHQGFAVSPNPASNYVNVTTSDREDVLTFIDVTGRELSTVKTTSFGKSLIDITGYPNLFFVKSQNGEVKKIVRK
jgi:uncharacterized repeat protein (TIGR03803 family)